MTKAVTAFLYYRKVGGTNARYKFIHPDLLPKQKINSELAKGKGITLLYPKPCAPMEQDAIYAERTGPKQRGKRVVSNVKYFLSCIVGVGVSLTWRYP